MLARRIIPCLDVAGGRVVKGIHFESLRDAGDPVEQATRYDAEGADELVFLDISASPDARRTTLDMVSRVAESIFIPFTVGGGIRSVADAGAALRAGADKVSVNTAAVRSPELVSSLAESFGSQCVVAAVDVRRSNGRYAVVVNGGREETPLEALEDGDIDHYEIAATLRKLNLRPLVVIELAYHSDTIVTRPLKEDLRLSRIYAEKLFAV